MLLGAHQKARLVRFVPASRSLSYEINKVRLDVELQSRPLVLVLASPTL